jgi:hypothetical protein
MLDWRSHPESAVGDWSVGYEGGDSVAALKSGAGQVTVARREF